MTESHERICAGFRRAGASTARGDDGLRHNVATDTSTYAVAGSAGDVDFEGVDATDFETVADFEAGSGEDFGDGRGVDVFCATGDALDDAEPLDEAEPPVFDITTGAPVPDHADDNADDDNADVTDANADDTDVPSGAAAVHALERATIAARRIDPRRSSNTDLTVP